MLWCGNWGLESAHKPVKRHWDKSAKKGGRQGGSGTAAHMLQRAALKIRFAHVAPRKRRRVSKRSAEFWDKVQQRVTQRLQQKGVVSRAAQRARGGRGHAL